MARTTRNPNVIVPAGLTVALTAVDAANGEQFGWTAKRALHVKNASGGSINVTVKSNLTVAGLVLPDRVVAVAAGAEKKIGPFDAAAHKQADGNVWVDYSSGTSVTAELNDQ
jgi:hypothetical protein